MDAVLEFKKLRRSLDNRHSLVEESASVASGQILAIKGPSGFGKSTLLRMLARLISSESGELYFQGNAWQSIPPAVWRRSVHYVAQKPVMLAGSVEDNYRQPFALGSVLEGPTYSRQFAEQYMKILDLPLELLEQNAQTLSGGEASRVALIRALLIEPTVLLLDEPTAYLDGDNRIKVMQLISQWVQEKPGRAVIMVSHDESDLYSIDGVSIMEIGHGQEAANNG